jgi:peptidoglycan hydrolase-like protein with peptidoglycan-binding domain
MKRFLFTALMAAALIIPAAQASAGDHKRHLTQKQVEAVQQSLRDAGYYRDAPVDGLWGRVSKNAIASFQSDKGLRVTGYPDRETRDRLGVRFPDTGQELSQNAKYKYKQNKRKFND